MNALPEDIINKISDFNSGDCNYWKDKFNKVLQDINNLTFYNEITWSCEDCYLCPKNQTEQTIPLSYDNALDKCKRNYIGKQPPYCQCKIIESKIGVVNYDYFVKSEFCPKCKKFCNNDCEY